MKSSETLYLFALAAVLQLGLLTGSATADDATLGAFQDTWIRDGFSHAANGVDEVLDNRLDFTPYIQFDMSGLDIDNISDATLTLWKVASARNDTITNERYATHGLTDDVGNTLQTWDELLDFDPTDLTNGLDFRNVGLDHTLNMGDGVNRTNVLSLDPEDGTTGLTETVDNGTGQITLTGATLVAFLNDRVDANGLVTFIIACEATNRGYGIASKENADPALRPALDLTFTTSSTSTILGDVDLSGEVDFLDISAFIAALSNGLGQAEADCNEDGEVDFLDISPFIAILSGS